jgi:hypothetical protein
LKPILTSVIGKCLTVQKMYSKVPTFLFLQCHGEGRREKTIARRAKAGKTGSFMLMVPQRRGREESVGVSSLFAIYRAVTKVEGG